MTVGGSRGDSVHSTVDVAAVPAALPGLHPDNVSLLGPVRTRQLYDVPVQLGRLTDPTADQRGSDP